tara:strand:- start:60846 stop:61427 length:582 start_codon:yes stop_codon:yes gene_type:complete
MPLLTKQSGAWTDLAASAVFLFHSGQIKNPTQAFIKRAGSWQPVFDAGNPWPASPLPAGTPRFGVAQFSDTDFTGGKTDPNPAGDPYIRWSGVQEFMDTVLLQQGTDIDLNVPYPEYGYFAHPKSMGTASIVDNAFGFEGGWDGAAWEEDGGTGSTTGPVEVTYDDGDGPKQWLVYRTDYSGLGQMSWSATIS